MDAKKFQSEKDVLIGIIIWDCIILIVISIVLLISSLESDLIPKLIILLITILSLVLLLWIWFDTSYSIDGSFLYYQSGPFRGKLEISKINKVLKNKTLWIGLKPALAQNGLIIQYEKWNQIYISPKEKTEFIAGLIKINDKIVVIE